MNKIYTFDSKINFRGTLTEKFTDDQIKNETMFFGCNLTYACAYGGPITNHFLDSLPADWVGDDVILDSRVHMLMPGWYPCIPGWHLDDVPRSRADGQPDHEDPEYRAEHLLCLIGDASQTLFALGSIRLEEPEPGKVIYGEWHPRVEEMVSSGLLRSEVAPENTLIEFDWRSMHRGQAATKNGWRWFVRITRGSKRPVRNEIRRQTQIYMGAPNVGW